MFEFTHTHVGVPRAQAPRGTSLCFYGVESQVIYSTLYVIIQVLIIYVSKEWVCFLILELFGLEGTSKGLVQPPLPWAGTSFTRSR